ncbi:Mitochondrial ribosomal protein L11 precursor [Klebsormidium nitens]|uniref:Large ribosomal subunit protein uL11m n=1 Tax=Klebsormidium nitens TaxID=105231 RepID=A0A1Y1HZ96_KLENI|nr:Mitochondrial ribosomal protein L11 precursor [Klebsormidium nitens]|eukprot:GAQ81857.1 Mitochondrial ribosomal protein L11 precursor [Klebsormidium nitens]
MAARAGKPVNRIIRLIVGAGQAKPAPPVGPALGAHKINLMAFCKDFNARTAKLKPDVPMAVSLTAYKDGSFDYELRSPSVSWFLKQAAGLEKGSGRAGHEAVAAVSAKDIYEIACIKQGDPNQAYIPLDRIADSIMGTARSMGIDVQTGDGT